MKIVFVHLGYFMALILLSFLSFFLILGAGFMGKINVFILFIPFVFSVLWLSDYTWRIFSINPKKIKLIRPAKNWAFFSLFLSGIFTVYSLFLTSMLPTPMEPAPPWMFLGTPILLLFIWYWLLYKYKKNNSNYTQMVLRSILFISSLVYAYQIFSFYLTHT
ncbi:hypothetical protein [Cytobacillus massiliigabonensis]|uniref:hypothetical protein n=1 Tax=Cytobacillus massiliigabonensis TaxID=1871011 RepID=UPI000C84CC40|nr:hypothetical protein [Cytobacillus massiliigabonensis]